MDKVQFKKEVQLKEEAYQLLNDLIKVVELNELKNIGNKTNLLNNPEFI